MIQLNNAPFFCSLFMFTHTTVHYGDTVPPAFYTSLLNLKAGLLHEVVEQTMLLEESSWAVKLDNLTLVQHDNTVAVEDGVETVGDRDDGAVGEEGRPQCALHHGVRLNVHGSGCLVQDEDVGRREHGAGQVDELSLALREVGPCEASNQQRSYKERGLAVYLCSSVGTSLE